MQSLSYSAIEKKLGITFKRRALLKLALTHPSSLQTNKGASGLRSNQTLEFLGDAVLELLTREYLLKKFPKASEGELSELKKMYTSTEALYKVGKKLGLGTFLFMDRGEEVTGGRDRPSNIAGCLEAVFGALYFDRGLSYVRTFTNKILFTKRLVRHKDYKSLLNQWAMRHRSQPCYRVIKEEGPPHNKRFYVDLYLDRKKVGQGSGDTKKKAEQEAARVFLQKNVTLKISKAK
jgi:ribonuclease-3